MRLMVDGEQTTADTAKCARDHSRQSAASFELKAAEWSALRSGDNAVRRRVFLCYAEVLHRAVRAWVRGIRPEDADDLVFEAFFRAFKNIAAAKSAETFEGWLLSLARNTAMDFCRKQGRAVRELSLEDLSAPAREHALQAARSEDATGLLAQLASQEDRSMLAALIGQVLAELPARQQQALLDRYRDGHTLQHIAAAQGIAEDAAGSLLYRARMAFREKFAKRSNATGRQVNE